MYGNLIKQLTRINEPFIYVTINKWMLDNEQTTLNLARDRMKKGQGVDGGIIGNYAMASYEYFKATEVNPLAGGKVDLFLTGALHKAMRIIPRSQGVYEIISTDWKHLELAEKYGAEQFGLTDKQHEQVKSKAIEEVINQIYKCYE